MRFIKYALVASLFLCARYAIAREAMRETNLQALYDSINRESFSGSLPDVQVTWGDLDSDGRTTFEHDSIRIEIDRGSVTSAKALREVLSHEACHVAVGADGIDGHGERFQECMTRF